MAAISVFQRSNPDNTISFLSDRRLCPEETVRQTSRIKKSRSERPPCQLAGDRNIWHNLLVILPITLKRVRHRIGRIYRGHEDVIGITANNLVGFHNTVLPLLSTLSRVVK